MIVAVSQKPAEGADTVRRANRDTRIVLCRYLRRGTKGQCTAEAVDPDGEILLCAHHLARVLELLRSTAPGLIGASL
ncbi:MAG: hypothetical protein ABW156_02440 [Jiangellaceae bacterium]